MCNDFLESKTAKTIHWFISLIGIIVAIFASVPQIKESFYKPCHELELIVLDIKINNTTFGIPVIFNNKGDYDEIITSISLWYVEMVDYGENNIKIAETENIYFLPRKNIQKKIFDITLDDENQIIKNLQYKISNNIVSFEVIFEVLTENTEHITQKLKIGNIRFEGDKMHFDMITQPDSINIDFTSASYKKTIQSFPRTTEYDPFPFIERH